MLTIRHLRYISFIEGVSFLLLLGIGMPLKYGMGIREVNYILGMGHGLLTLVFCVVLFMIWAQKRLSFRWCAFFFLASFVPFGAFFVEINVKKHLSSFKL